jgi:hypothetical protein
MSRINIEENWKWLNFKIFIKKIKRLKKWQKSGQFFLNLIIPQFYSFFQLDYITLYSGMFFWQEIWVKSVFDP